MPFLPNRLRSPRIVRWWRNFRHQAFTFIYR